MVPMHNRHIALTSIGDDAVRLALIGDIDAACAVEIQDHIARLAEVGTHLEIDLTATTFLDSDGAAPLIAAARKALARHDELVIIGWSAAAEHLRDALRQLTPSCH